MSDEKRAFDCEVRAVEGAERTLTFTASTERVARDGDIIAVKGWDTKEFQKNPVFLWSHEAWSPPIGRAVAVRKVSKGDVKRLEIDVEFAGFEQMHELAEQVYSLYRDGFLKAVSVGFRPMEFRDLSDKAREKLGLGKYGRYVSKAELYEVSAVSVPADPGALLTAAAENPDVRDAALAIRSAFTEEDQARLDALRDEPDPPQPREAPEPTGHEEPLSETRAESIDLQAVFDVEEQIERLQTTVDHVVDVVRDIRTDLRTRGVQPASGGASAPEHPEPPPVDDEERDLLGVEEALRRRTQE